MSPTSKILTIRSIPILTACLLGLAPVAFSQAVAAAPAQTDKADKADKPDKDLCSTKLGKSPKTNDVCVDLKAPVTSPLPLELLPNVKLTIHVVNKSPWQKVNIECKFSVIEDPKDTQLANLAKRLGSWGAVLIPEVTDMKALTDPTITKSQPAGEQRIQEKENRPEPFLSAFRALDEMYKEIKENLKARKGELEDAKNKIDAAKEAAKAGLKSISSSPDYKAGLKVANDKFTPALEEAIKALEPAPPKSAQTHVMTLDDAKAQLDRIKFMASSQIYLDVKPEYQRNWVERELAMHLQHQSDLESAAAKLAQDTSDASTALALFKAVREEGSGRWFEYSEEPQAPENRTAACTVKLEERLAPGATKSDVVIIGATWKKPFPVSLSLGYAMTSLARTDFSLTTLPAASAGGAVTYQLSATNTRPIAFPLVLLHYDIPHALPATHWGFAFSGGAGADVTGSTPTGEFAAGGSLRYRSLYFSGLLHFGRRKELQGGQVINVPVQAGTTPVTQDVWGKGFAFAITYRGPL